MAIIRKVIHGQIIEVDTDAHKGKAGRKPLPTGHKRKMYSTRLHPNVISMLDDLKTAHKGKPISRILESLIIDEHKRLGF